MTRIGSLECANVACCTPRFLRRTLWAIWLYELACFSGLSMASWTYGFPMFSMFLGFARFTYRCGVSWCSATIESLRIHRVCFAGVKAPAVLGFSGCSGSQGSPASPGPLGSYDSRVRRGAPVSRCYQCSQRPRCSQLFLVRTELSAPMGLITLRVARGCTWIPWFVLSLLQVLGGSQPTPASVANRLGPRGIAGTLKPNYRAMRVAPRT